MNAQVRRKLEMATRVREFSRAHVSPDPSYGIVLSRLEDRLTRAEAIAARQHTGMQASRGATAHRKELRRILHHQLLRYLVSVGQAAIKDSAEVAERFKLPVLHSTNAAFLTSAKSLIAAAESERERLLAEGMSATLLEDLSKMVTEFEAASESTRTARRDHIGARAELETVTENLLELVRVLDGINRYRYGKDPELMIEWNAARTVPVQKKGTPTPPPVGEGPGSAPPGSVAPAA
jgi:hypothetical protein